MRGTKLYGIIAAAFMAGAFLASPELRAYAANTVFSSDIVDGEVKSADIATNAVKSAEIASNAVGSSEIAADSVGASEINGVTKLNFQKYTLTSTEADTTVLSEAFGNSPLEFFLPGIEPGDNFIVTLNTQSVTSSCIVVSGQLIVSSDNVKVFLYNQCSVQAKPGPGSYLSIIVFANNIT